MLDGPPQAASPRRPAVLLRAFGFGLITSRQALPLLLDPSVGLGQLPGGFLGSIVLYCAYKARHQGGYSGLILDANTQAISLRLPVGISVSH